MEESILERTKELADALEREKSLNELKSHFISLASHEFKTPLGAIQVCLNVLEGSNTSDFEQRRLEYYGHIRSSVKSMFEIMDDFLSLNKLEEGQINTENDLFDITHLVTSEKLRMALTCKDGQSIHYSHYGQHQIVGDRQVLKSILLNLLSNAIKYSDQDIDISTEVDQSDIRLVVSDKGIGIPEAEQKKLYQKFFRASNVSTVQGTGLGLNIVKKYVDLLGGTINCFSAINTGSTFEVNLPAYPYRQPA